MKFKRGLAFNQVDKLGLVALISSTGLAIIGTIWAIYLDSFFHNASYVGFLSTFFAIVTFASYIFTVPIIEKNSKSKIYSIAVFTYAIFYFVLAIVTNLYVVIIIGTIISIISALKITSFGLILIDKSKNKDVSKNVGLVYTLFNFAWLLGPLIAGIIIKQYTMNVIFYLASGLIFISFLLFRTFEINKKSKIIDGNYKKILIDYFKNKDRRLSYIISGGMHIWLTLIYVYIPIYIVESGLNASVVGFFLFAHVTPLILLEYYFGKLAGKIGFKKTFIIGYSIIGTITILCFFIPNIYMQLGLILIASIGLAMIEPTTEAYFFDLVGKQKEKFYGPYNTTIDVNSIVALFLSAIILLFLPYKFLFLFIGIIMLIFAGISLKTKNIVEGKRG